MSRATKVWASWEGKAHEALDKYLGIPVHLHIGRIHVPEDYVKHKKIRKRVKREHKRYEPVMTGSKKCRRCNQKKSVLDFHKDAASQDGRRSMCSECKNEVAKGSMKRLRAMKSAA